MGHLFTLKNHLHITVTVTKVTVTDRWEKDGW